MGAPHYDILIVGAGVAGCTLAHALSSLRNRRTNEPLRIALLERSLSEPDRIVGELLQPGGVAALRRLGLESCLEGIDAVPEYGYCVLDGPKSVRIPYTGTHEGCSFHHGRFIMALRAAAKRAQGVHVVEATVTELVEEEAEGRVVGVRAVVKGKEGEEGEKAEFFADLVVVADGCFSNFRNIVMGEAIPRPTTGSHFVGTILEDAKLPIPNHGTVAFIKGGYGPVLLYQISEHDTRILIDVKTPLPSDLKAYILDNILPQLPTSLHLPLQKALAQDRLRRMPNSFLPPVQQGVAGTKKGVILLGDSWNMRHPLTGGGMTVAFADVVMLQSLLADVEDLRDWDEMKRLLNRWHWRRKPLASTINILSFALYNLFGADGELLAILRAGCFKYFELGGECINGPVSLLAGVAPSVSLLAMHFFAVAFYSIWVAFTHPRAVISSNVNGEYQKPVYTRPSVAEYPLLLIKSVQVFWTACVVFGPLLWSEIRWWAPSSPSPHARSSTSNSYVRTALSCAMLAFLGLAGASVAWGFYAPLGSVGS